MRLIPEDNYSMTMGIVKEKISYREFLVKDMFSDNVFTMTLYGKEAMVYTSLLNKSDEIHIVYSDLFPGECKMITMTTLKHKGDNRLSKMHREVEKHVRNFRK